MNGTEVKLTLPQVQRHEICNALIEGRLTTAEAAVALGLSPRQVQRLKARLQADGPQGPPPPAAPAAPLGRPPRDTQPHKAPRPAARPQAPPPRNPARAPANKPPTRRNQQVLHLPTTTYAQFNFYTGNYHVLTPVQV